MIIKSFFEIQYIYEILLIDLFLTENDFEHAV